MTRPFYAAQEAFAKAEPQLPLKLHFDNAVILARHIKKGDEPDIFVSPGETEIGNLVKQGLIDPDSVTTIGTFSIALIAPAANPAKIRSLEDLTRPEVKRIALAAPEENSIGEYARQSLRKLGLWDKIQGKLTLREHALDSVQLVAGNRVEAAIVYETCPLESAPEKAPESKVKIIAQLPPDSHPPVRVQAGIHVRSPNPKAARKFLDFLLTPEVQKRFEETGLPGVANLDSR
jgi:molybdate transport system substrate-binding protein